VNTLLKSGWFGAAVFYLLPAIALIRYPLERRSLFQAIIKAGLYGWCIIAVLTAVASRFERHPSFTWRDSLLGATMYLVFASPLVGLIVWGVNGSTRAGFKMHGKSIYYDPDFDRSHPKADKHRPSNHRDGA
jgi:hypothetical protein